MIRFHLRELMADKQFELGERLTLAQVSEATGIHRTTLSKIANQRGYNASTEVVDRLCTYFDVPVEKVISFIKE